MAAEAATPGTTTGAMGPAVLPLAGRARQMERLRAAMDNPRCRGVVLAGAAGAGKGRMGSEAVAMARDRDWAVIETVATPDATAIPFGAFAHLFVTSRPPATDSLEQLCQARNTLLAKAGGKRMALLVDDAQFLDGSSAALVYHLAATDAGFLVLALTSEVAAPDSLVRLWRDGRLDFIELPPLSPTDIDELLTTFLDGPVSRATIETLHRHCNGVPSFLADLVDSGITSGALSRRNGIWSWCGPMSPSAALRRAIANSLQGLPRQQRSLLEVLAVGGDLDAAVVEDLSSPETRVALERAGFIRTVDDDGRLAVALAHLLHREVLEAGLGRLQVRSIFGQLAHAADVLSVMNEPAERARATMWKLEAGWRVDPETLADAAQWALDGGDGSMAERLARTSVGLADDCRSRRLLGEALIMQGRPAEAEIVLASVRPESATDDELVEVAVCRALNLFRHLRRSTQAEEILDRCAAIAGNEQLRDRVRVARAMLLLYRGKPAEANQLASVACVDEAATLSLQVSGIRTVSLLLSGRSCSAEAALEAGLTNVPKPSCRDGADAAAARLAALRWDTLWFNGDIEMADTLAHELYRRAVSADAVGDRALAAFMLGLAAREKGALRSAVRWLEEATAWFREADPFSLPAALAALAKAAASQADIPRAERALAEADAALGDRVSDQVRVELSRAWCSAARCELSTAEEIALRSADLAARHQMAALEATALHDISRLGGARRVAGRLQDLTENLEGRLFPAFCRHTLAVRDHDGAALNEIATTFEAMGYRLHAAEAASEAAQAFRTRGERRQAQLAERRAVALSGTCEGARTPALRHLGRGAFLTPREREISGLAATGLTNRQIARLLGISVRTVDNLLHRTYGKLGIDGRTQLPAEFF
jgi:DNA-binding CsgD family transcriptional regulator